jgi:AraC-like DNA-binding protein
MRFFEGRRMSLPRDCSRHIFEILAEASATFDIPVSDPLTKKMELLSDPALGGTQMIKNRLEMLLILLLRRETSRKETGDLFLRDEAPGGLLADAIIGKMRAHLYEALSVEALCEGIAYSRSYIFRAFREATGETIASYYNKLRVAEAKRLIREKNLSLSEISDLLSFDSPNYFGKTFKRFTGVTPRAYRARYHG